MPCTDSRDNDNTELYTEIGRLREENAKVSAIACAALRALDGNNMLEEIDYEEAGVTRLGTVEWFEKHKLADKRRKLKEAKDKARAEAVLAARRSGLNKLSPLERQALGLASGEED
jgi:hypothetical protein